MLNRVLILSLIVTSLMGCSAVSTPVVDSSGFQNIDGIDKWEAIALAQRYTEHNSPEIKKSHLLDRLEIRRTTLAWSVYFYPRFHGERIWYEIEDFTPWRVVIDPVSGEVLNARITEGLEKY